MSMHSQQALQRLRQQEDFKTLLLELQTLVPSPLLYKACNKGYDEQTSDWVYNSGRIAQGRMILEFLTGKTDNEVNL